MQNTVEASTVTTYQFEIDGEKWRHWKDTVPRSKSLDDRIRELIEADTEGRVVETEGRERTGDDDLRARAEATLDELAVPGRDASVERNRREAILWAWDYLRRHGDATSSEIANATFGYFWDCDLGYSVSARYPGYQLWDSVVRDALRELPGVDGPAERGNEWAFVDKS